MSLGKKKIFMYHSSNSGVGYYRVWQPAKYLKEFFEIKRLKDEDCEKKIPFENVNNSNYDKEIGTYKDHAEWSDLLLFQNVENPKLIAFIEAVRNVLKKPVGMDVDDNVEAITDYNPVVIDLLQTDGIYWQKVSLQKVDFVTTTTPYLANVLKKYNKNVEIIPNYVDFDDYDNEVKDYSKINIAFLGSTTHYKDLSIVLQPLRILLKECDNVVFKYFGVPYDFVKGLKMSFPDKVIIKQWVPIQDYFKVISKENIHILLAPLLDNEFNRSKSNVKYLEAGAIKSVCVASDVEPYKCINDGVTGYRAVSQNDFKEILFMLVKDVDLIKKISENAYNDVYTNWNIKTKIQDRVNIYKRYLQ